MGSIILINKQVDYTSSKITQIVKKLTNSKKAGHSGTLDPLASGLLIIATDEKTKELEKLLNLDKTYVCEIKFGEHTETYDREGKILNKSNNFPTLENVEKQIIFFKESKYFQEVPIYSSVKIKGKKLYEYARANEEVELPIKEVKIKNINLLNFNESSKTITLELNVSKGFYVRSFAVDFARKLDCYAHIHSLHRTKIGNYKIEDALTSFDELWKYHTKVSIITRDFEFISSKENLIIGQFDILHCGQEKILNEKNYNALIFINNPSKNYYSNSVLNRILNLSEFNPNKIYVYDIGAKNSNITGHDFNSNYLRKINPFKIIIGENFKYGCDKRDVNFLADNFHCEIIPVEKKCSSTYIRELLLKGEIIFANSLFLKRFKIQGIVIHGTKKGKTLNFPTLNVEWKTNIGMKSGSYSSITKIDKKFYESTTLVWETKNNIVLTETFVHSFDKYSYGKFIEVWPIKYINELVKLDNDLSLAIKIKNEVQKSIEIHEFFFKKIVKEIIKIG